MLNNQNRQTEDEAENEAVSSRRWQAPARHRQKLRLLGGACAVMLILALTFVVVQSLFSLNGANAAPYKLIVAAGFAMLAGMGLVLAW